MALQNIPDQGLVTMIVKVGGSTIPDESKVFAVDITFGINKISSARIVILDGDSSTGKFNASSSSTFVPGAEITIEAGYNAKNTEVFKGVIVSQNIQINNNIGSALEVICSDEAIKTTIGRKSKTFSQKSDSDIITGILGSYSGITSNVKATKIKWPQMVQYDASDWDFILERAEANGLLIKTVNNKVTVFDPIADTTSVLKLTYGSDILEFNGNLNSVNQFSNVKADAWDFASQSIISEEASNDFAGAGNISSKKLSEVIGLQEFQLQTSATLNKEELKDWSKAQMLKSELSKFCGEVSCQGNNLVQPSNFITFEGLGDRFNGDHFVSGVSHSIYDGNWITKIAFGLSQESIAETSDIMSLTASGLLPGVHGLFTAKVKKVFEDPENQYRILVDIPLFDAEGEGLWARLSNFYASNHAGAFFLPEVGDEDIVGFLNEDPRFPIIIGSLYSNNKHAPFNGFEPNQNNSVKGIVTKSGIQITFDDEKKALTLMTSDTNKVILNDTDKQITIEDQHSNSIVMSENGINIKSAKNITIEADQNLILKGTQGVTIASAAGDVEISGMNIKEKAEIEYTAEGAATASVQAGAELTLKGAMVMIN